MKTTWVIAAALLLVAAATMDASARGRSGKHGFNGHAKDGGYTKRGGYTKDGGYTSLSDSLGLTEDQQAQIETLQETLNEQRQALSDQYRTGFEALLTEEQLAIFEGIVNPLGLTEDQQTQIDALQEQGLTGYGFLISLATILTEDQIAALDENGFGKHGLGWRGFNGHTKGGGYTKRGGYTSLSDSLGLTEDQQAQIETLQETLNEQRQALSDQYRTGFEALLTEEQLAIFEGIVNPLGLTEDQQAQIEALQEQGLTGYGFLISLATILTEDQIAALDETGFGKYGFGKYGFGKHGFGKYGFGKHGFGKYGFGKHGFGCYSKDSEEETETTETAAAGKAAAVEETSWGRVKDSFGR